MVSVISYNSVNKISSPWTKFTCQSFTDIHMSVRERKLNNIPKIKNLFSLVLLNKEILIVFVCMCDLLVFRLMNSFIRKSSIIHFPFHDAWIAFWSCTAMTWEHQRSLFSYSVQKYIIRVSFLYHMVLLFMAHDKSSVYKSKSNWVLHGFMPFTKCCSTHFHHFHGKTTMVFLFFS